MKCFLFWHNWNPNATFQFRECGLTHTTILYKCDKCHMVKTKDVQGDYILNKEQKTLDNAKIYREVNNILSEG